MIGKHLLEVKCLARQCWFLVLEEKVKELDDRIKALEAELLQEASDLRRLTQERRELRKLIAEDHVT